ncbi:ATP-binding cassette, subfamily F, uup [Pseudarcicella hirudinis]|uniref:ATP-binding cassette, subfamily F, uup n=1 Tax=Pseudarcicella hirudinis TaxID=1079859 RepID=A0A1I5QQ02_9BACT|nr:ABC-F family ATP-binding cassette domain-containing protein [Pseudarcicella hirudinis]SFP48081.1 ATP-binding cassette, subfamily F, uup [Pseudarcicella hirudinis]
MNYLSAENISKNFGERWLFQDLNFGISRGEKIALVGQNGSGKTSLLNILAGKFPADSGSVSIRKGITVGYLAQNPEFDETLTVLDTLFSGDLPMVKAFKEYEEAMLSHDVDRQTDAITQMDALQAWDYESKVQQILGKLGIVDLDKVVSQLSGGQRKRVAMARILIEEPDLLIFDEPTNHLDLDTIEWLEGTLSSQNITLLLVSHDRYFLDRVCNVIVELDRGKAFSYKGNYAYFLEKKAEREAIEASEIDKAKNTYRKELEWMRRQPKARGTKAQYRIDAFQEIDKKAHSAVEKSSLELNVKMSRQGSKIIEIEGLNKSYGEKTLVKDFSYVFKKKDRIGIIGKNGVGKSTFLNLLTQVIKPDSGIVEKGETIVFGYYTQSDLEFREDQRVIDIIKEIAEVVTVGTGETISASQFLNHFLFDPKKQYTLVSKLSGGEKRRLQLMKVLIRNPNFLILDEPTNDLDITTLNVLEDFLLNFGGCLLLVSHDRYFMDTLVENLFLFEGEGNIRNFNGNYTDYREWLKENESGQNQKSSGKTQEVVNLDQTSKIQQPPAAAKRKLSFKEQKEHETLGTDIQKLENRKKDLTDLLNKGEGNYEELEAWAKEIEQINENLDEKELRWLELEELI